MAGGRLKISGDRSVHVLFSMDFSFSELKSSFHTLDLSFYSLSISPLS